MSRYYLTLLVGVSLHATTIIVNTTGDANLSTGGLYVTGGTIDLRGALNFINTQPTDTYDIQFSAPQTMVLAAPLPPLGFPLAGQSFSTAPTIVLNQTNPVAITINGNATFRPFYTHQAHVTLANMTISQGQGAGGTGGNPSGGGGAGLGGGLFVGAASDVTLSNVAFSNCGVAGGAGASVTVFTSQTAQSGGGGGGLGGNGGSGAFTSAVNPTLVVTGAGGGGGFSPGANGGNGGSPNGSTRSGASGGGGGFNGAGGSALTASSTQNAGGGGGGGYGSNTATGGAGAATVSGVAGGGGGRIPNSTGTNLGGGGGGGGGSGGSLNAGTGGSSAGSACTSGTTANAGGNGGGVTTGSCPCTTGIAMAPQGGSGGCGGGGGGGGGITGGSGILGGDGGAGGIGGGGGGSAANQIGGQGDIGGGGGGFGGSSLKFGGGGGGQTLLSAGVSFGGGNGGFGGGGGGCADAGTQTGGAGGFGGGGGGANNNAMATRGLPGPCGGLPTVGGATSGGGGGAALGAAIFVENGGSLTYQSTSSGFLGTTGSFALATANVSPNSSGVGFVGPLTGDAVQEIFGVTGTGMTLNFASVGSSNSLTITAAIADDTPQSVAPSATYGATTGTGISVAINPAGQTGTVILNGQSTYGGNGTAGTSTTISGGTLQIAQDSSLGAPNVPLVFAANSTLSIPSITTSRPMTINGSVTGTFSTTGDTTISSTIAMGNSSSLLFKNQSGTLRLSGNYSSPAGFAVDNGTLVFSGTNTYLRTTTVNGTVSAVGVLQADAVNTFSPNATHLLTGFGTLDLNGLSQTIGLLSSLSTDSQVLLGAGTLTIAGTSPATFAGQISGTGGLTGQPTAGSLLLTGSSSYSGATTLNNTFLLQGGALNAFSANSVHTLNDGSTLNLGSADQTIGALAGTGSGASVQLGTHTLTLAKNGQTTQFAGQILGTSGGLTCTGTGSSLTMSGSSSYSGATSLQNDFILVGGAANAFSSTSAYTLLGTSILNLGGFDQTIGSIASASATTKIQLTSGTLTTGGTATFAGQIEGTGGITAQQMSGSLTLSGSSSYSGLTTLGNNFILAGGAAGSLSPNSTHTLNDTSTLDLGGFDQTIGALAGASSPGAVVSLGSNTLTTGNNNATTNFQGQIQGTGGLTYVGTGAFTLSGTSTYNGPTSVQNGTLIVTGSLQSAVTVMAGAILKGTGNLQDVSIQSGGTIQAGQSIGTITLGSLTLVSGANLQLEIAPGINNSSKYTVNGNVDLGGSTLNILADNPIGDYSPSDSYTFITSTNAIVGTFGTVNFPTGLEGTIDYSDPNNVILRLLSVTPPTPPIPPPVPPIPGGGNLTPGEGKILGYLNNFLSVPALRSILLDLSNSTPSQLKASLDSINPARNAASTYFANLVFFRVNDISLQRLHDGRMMQRGALKSSSKATAMAAKYEALRAQNDEVAYQELAANKQAKQSNPAGRSRTLAASGDHYSFWGTGFGEFISQKGMHKNPKIHDIASGAVIGFDDYGCLNGIFSLAIGYIHNDISENHSAGNGNSNGVSFQAYGTGYIGDGYLEGGLSFGWSRFHMHRHIVITGASPFDATAKSSFSDWQFMPHLGGGYDWTMNWGVIEPFASVDWVGSWQSSYTEKGASPLNMHVKSQNPSMLRSQVGCNFYETWDKPSYLVIFEQSASYVNKVPFHMNVWSSLALAPTALGGSAPGSIGTVSYDRVLNLAGITAELFYKHKKSGFFMSAAYYGEFGSSYRSNDVTGTLGIFF